VANFLLIGSALGALVGLLHAVHLFRQISPRAKASGVPGGRTQGIYYGLTAFVLWSLFGSYVLALWFVGALAYPIVYMARRWKRAERAI